MRKLNGITINGEYLGNSVVINGMFRAICTISPVIMRDFVQIINKIEKLDDAVKIHNFNCGFDSIDIEFGNNLSKGIASLYFKLQNGEPELTNYKLVIDGKEYSPTLNKISLPNKSQMTNPNAPVEQIGGETERQRRLRELKEKKLEQQKKLLEEKKQKIEELKKQKLEELKRKKELQSLPPEERKKREKLELLKKKREELLKKKQEASLTNSGDMNTADIGMDRNLSQTDTETKIDEIARSNQPEGLNNTISDTTDVSGGENLLNEQNSNASNDIRNIQNNTNDTIPQNMADNSATPLSDQIENSSSDYGIQDKFDSDIHSFEENEDESYNYEENSTSDYSDNTFDNIDNIDDIDYDNLSDEELAQLEAELDNEINGMSDSMGDFDSEEAMLDAELNKLMSNDSSSFGQSDFNYSNFAKELNEGLSQGLIQGLSQGLSEGLSQGLSQGLSALFGNGGFNPNFNNGGMQNDDFSQANPNNIPLGRPQNTAPDYSAIDEFNNDAAMSARDSYAYDDNSDLDELSDFYSDFYSEVPVDLQAGQEGISNEQGPIDATDNSEVSKIMAELEALKTQIEPGKNLMSKDEFLDRQRALEEAKEKKRRQKFRIVGSREKINASALEDGIFVSGKKFYKWGDPKILDS